MLALADQWSNPVWTLPLDALSLDTATSTGAHAAFNFTAVDSSGYRCARQLPF